MRPKNFPIYSGHKVSSYNWGEKENISKFTYSEESSKIHVKENVTIILLPSVFKAPWGILHSYHFSYLDKMSITLEKYVLKCTLFPQKNSVKHAEVFREFKVRWYDLKNHKRITAILATSRKQRGYKNSQNTFKANLKLNGMIPFFAVKDACF